MNRFRVGVSPHLQSPVTTRSLMLDVCLALSPLCLWSVFLYGARVITLLLVSCLSCLLFEGVTQLLCRKKVTLSDGSALVSGILLALTMPVSVPLFLLPLGAFFAMVIVKQLFGGLGKNLFNPVLAARVFLFISFPQYMTRYTLPETPLSPFSLHPEGAALADGITSATPLASLKNGEIPDTEPLLLLTGEYAGTLGETSSLLILAGAAYLLVRRVITWHVPVAFLGTMGLLALLFPSALQRGDFLFFSLFSGGLLLGAVFMATDYVTSPVTSGGKLLYGVLCGAITFLIRRFGAYPEGVSFAILIGNLSVWYLDRLCRPRPYGTKKKTKGGDPA